MTGLKDEMIRAMKIQGYAERTIKLYATCLGVFSRYCGRSPLETGPEEIEDFLLGMRESGRSDSTVRVYYEALKYFFCLNRQRERLPSIKLRPRRRRLPVVLAQSEVGRLLDGCEGLRLRTILTVIYSSGLRVSEAAGLLLSDVDFEGMRIHVRMGKNGKGRQTVLARSAAELLRTYINVYRPSGFLFYRLRDISRPVPVGSVQSAFRRLVRSRGIGANFHVHCLRHCFATHLLENGTDIFLIMKLLGHSSIQATMVYLHVRDLGMFNIESPLDRMRDRTSAAARKPFVLPGGSAGSNDGQRQLWG